MATISYSFNVTNGSGAYTIQVKNCSGTATVYADNISGQATNGVVNGTLTNAALNQDLGSVKIVIYDSNNSSVINESGCFNHNCTTCVSITDFTLSTPTASLTYADDINCIISGVDGNSPHSYYFTLKQGGSVIATNTNNSSNVFTFTNNLCPNEGIITVDASVVNCGGTVNKTNTITVSSIGNEAPVLTSCYLGSNTWRVNATLNIYPGMQVALYNVFDSFMGYFTNVSNSNATLELVNPPTNVSYKAKSIVCGVTSSYGNEVFFNFTPTC